MLIEVKTTLFSICVQCLLIGSGPPASAMDEETIELLLKEADCAYQNGEASSAVPLCQKVIQAHPHHLEALNKLGTTSNYVCKLQIIIMTTITNEWTCD